MSIVGPRPLSRFYLGYYKPEEKTRHNVKPGLTGLAQVNGRNAISWDDKFKYDIKYVDRISFLNDILILLKTIVVVFKRDGIGERNQDDLIDMHEERSYMNKYREIGSSFELNPNYDKTLIRDEKELFNELLLYGNERKLVSSGRGATSLVIETILKKYKDINKTVLLPSYTCESVIEPFLNYGFKVYYYNITSNLKVNKRNMIDKIKTKNISIVLFHSLFGFNNIKNINKVIRKFKSNKIIFIEDITHNLYSTFKRPKTQFKIASLRKWLELPDGGLVISKKDKLVDIIQGVDEKFEEIKLKASTLKYNYLNGEDIQKQIYLDLFNKAENMLENQLEIHDISYSSKKILLSTDINLLRSKRRNNYNLLYKNLCNINGIEIITPKLKETEVPLYFTLKYKGRSDLQKFLRDYDIYAPIIWPKPNIEMEVDENSLQLYDSLISIPCDQRYNDLDMYRIIDVINEYFNNKEKV